MTERSSTGTVDVLELIAELRRHERDYPSLVHGPLCGLAAGEIERLCAVAQSTRDAEEASRYFDLASEFGHQLQKLTAVVQDAIDILAERKHGNPARSSGHNARVILETAMKSVPASALPSTSLGTEPSALLASTAKTGE